MNDDAKRVRAILKEIEHRRRTNRIRLFFPDSGKYRRELYQRHMEAFRLGASKRVRVIQAGNRVGKTEGLGGVELTYHLTGDYPAWWEGKRFTRPIKAWAAGDTKETTRDILQAKLLGPVGQFGTGLIPMPALGRYSLRANSGGAVEWIKVRHVSGGWSLLGFKSYEQGRKSFQGTEQHFILLDEECPLPIYEECMLRLTTTRGLILLTYTPLEGRTKLIRAIADMQKNGRAVKADQTPATVSISVFEVPHLSEQDIEDIKATTSPHTWNARLFGIPGLGEGAVYPVPVSEVVCKPFQIPSHWPRVYGMDVGWNRTAVVWGAIDKESDTVYLYAEHYVGKAEPAVHANGIKLRGDWIPGVIDKAARGTSPTDGDNLLLMYRKLGLKLTPTDVSDPKSETREGGIMQVLARLSTGRLKVFSTLQNWISEYENYHRKEDRNGESRIVKEDDHLMDATRYLIVWGLKRARVFAPTNTGPLMPEQTFGLYGP